MAPQRSMPCRIKVFRSCRFGKLGCVRCTIARDGRGAWGGI